MRQPFVPVDFNSPQKSLLGDYHLESIKIDNTQEDLDAILSNANAVTTIRGGSGSIFFH